jgi:hypothetical protein
MAAQAVRAWSEIWRESASAVASRPILIVNPRSDQAFLDLAQRCVSEGVASPDDLQSRLRHDYPLAVVRERTLSSELRIMWYVYREGRWVSGRFD